MIGYTLAEMDIRAGHGDPYATGKDQDAAMPAEPVTVTAEVTQ